MDRRKSASSIKHKVIGKLKIAISSHTVYRRNHEIGFHERVALEKPYLNTANQVKRLTYVKMYQAEGVTFWKHVL